MRHQHDSDENQEEVKQRPVNNEVQIGDSNMEVDDHADQSQEIGSKRKRRFRKNADEESVQAEDPDMKVDEAFMEDEN